MTPPLLHTIANQQLWLSPNRSLYWEEQQTLILSDLHLGKATHFRKAGIPIPQDVFKNDIHKLTEDIQHFKPSSIIIVGDLFHSNSNIEFALFAKWRSNFANIPITLVMGNHDVGSHNWFAAANITVVKAWLHTPPFMFVHDYKATVLSSDYYTISGHVHPGISLKGMGRQSLTFPCFYFAKQYAILPAYGNFTGLHIIKPNKQEAVYAVVQQEVIKVM